MARILVPNQHSDVSSWYDQLEPSTYYESEFEQKILLHASSVYPNFYVVPFKKIVSAKNPDTGEIETVKPDLAFVAKDYQEWWIVEVEMGDHRLSHVIPQVKKLANAGYSYDEAEYLAERLKELKESELKRLMLESAPKVLVIVNEQKTDWLEPLKKLDVYITTFQVFVSENGHESFLADGMYPLTYVELLSNCSLHPVASNVLRIHSPENLELPENREDLRLTYHNYLTEWRRYDELGSTWIQARHRSPLKPRMDYQIRKRQDGLLALCEVDRIAGT